MNISMTKKFLKFLDGILSAILDNNYWRFKPSVLIHLCRKMAAVLIEIAIFFGENILKSKHRSPGSSREIRRKAVFKTSRTSPPQRQVITATYLTKARPSLPDDVPRLKTLVPKGMVVTRKQPEVVTVQTQEVRVFFTHCGHFLSHDINIFAIYIPNSSHLPWRIGNQESIGRHVAVLLTYRYQSPISLHRKCSQCAQEDNDFASWV
jgi:hypothetical protein